MEFATTDANVGKAVVMSGGLKKVALKVDGHSCAFHASVKASSLPCTVVASNVPSSGSINPAQVTTFVMCCALGRATCSII